MLDSEPTEDCEAGTAVGMLWCNGLKKTAEKVTVTYLKMNYKCLFHTTFVYTGILTKRGWLLLPSFALCLGLNHRSALWFV
jgi:hypothetical protein